MNAWENRHPSTQHFAPLFKWDHLPHHLAVVSQPFAELAVRMLALPDGPELSTCLRKLLEAKDCAVRAALLSATDI